MQNSVPGILPFRTSYYFYLCLTLSMSCFLTVLITTRKRCLFSQLVIYEMWLERDKNVLSSLSFQHNRYTERTLVEWLSSFILASDRIRMTFHAFQALHFLFHGIDLDSMCPRKSFNHSWSLAWILTASSGACCNPGKQTTCGWYTRGWERSPALPWVTIGRVCMHHIPDMLTSTVFPVGDKGWEDPHISLGIQHHYCDLSPLTRQKAAYLAALSSRSIALLSGPFLKLSYIKKQKPKPQYCYPCEIHIGTYG